MKTSRSAQAFPVSQQESIGLVTGEYQHEFPCFIAVRVMRLTSRGRHLTAGQAHVSHSAEGERSLGSVAVVVVDVKRVLEPTRVASARSIGPVVYAIAA